MTKEAPTLLFVHGGGHSDPAYLVKFFEELGKVGISAVGGSAPSDGGFPPEGRAMYGDADYWHEKIQTLVDAGKEVVVFGHSMGGVVGPEGAQGLTKADREKKGLPGGVVHFIFLAAILIDEGETVMTLADAGLVPVRVELGKVCLLSVNLRLNMCSLMLR